MCRITGILNFGRSDGQELEKLCAAMRDTMAYGGPDDFGNYKDETGKVFLGHRRLSIIDVSADGHQPMFYNEWVVVFNGEIYNYKEIQQELGLLGCTFSSGSDTEVLLKAFDKWGYDAVQRFRGMFAFALWNTKTNKLLLCRDRVGVKPLYWYKKDGIFLFGSELKSLRKYPQFDTTINKEAVSLFLQTGYIKSPSSIFKHAYKVEPGGFLEIDMEGNIKQWKYWDVNNIKPREDFLTDESVLTQAEDLLLGSSEYRMVADVPVGIFLSGGVDSSLVTALLQKNASRPLKTFTIGFHDKHFDESGHAKKVAEHLGTDHYELICTQENFRDIIPQLPDMYDEPFGDSSAIPTHLVSGLAREQVTVALSADGGDEVFTGYIRYSAIKDYYNKIKYLPLGTRKLLSKALLSLDYKTIEKIFSRIGLSYNFRGLEWRLPKFCNALTASDELDFFELSSLYIQPNQLKDLLDAPRSNIFVFDRNNIEKDYLFSSLGKIDIGSYLEGDILTKVDRASMAVALEGREPLLDHKLIEFGLSLPDKYKIRNKQTKWILRNILYKYVPKELIERPKQGFAIPIKEWLQTELKHILVELSEDKKFCELFSFNHSELKKIISTFLSPSNTSINPHFIWFLYSLYTWYKRWI
jgi:asparagine synthase (glutamine-hydrolysing)